MELTIFKNLQEDQVKTIKSIALGALVFGIGGLIQGYFLGYPYEIYGIELRYPGFLALGIIAGILLGVLSKDFKKTIILSLLGFLGAFAPLIFYILLPVYMYFGILEGLFFIFIIAPVFLIFGFYYLIKKRKLHSATCLFFPFSGSLTLLLYIHLLSSDWLSGHYSGLG
jgi:hypothetical protein